jgi:hypothetical protein
MAFALLFLAFIIVVSLFGGKKRAEKLAAAADAPAEVSAEDTAD